MREQPARTDTKNISTQANIEQKIQLDFYNLVNDMKRLKAEYQPDKWAYWFLFSTSKNQVNKTVEVSMRTIWKKNRMMKSELSIIRDKNGFTLIERANSTYWNTTQKETKANNLETLLPYFNKIKHKFYEYKKVQKLKSILLAEQTDKKQADDLLSWLTA